MKFAYRFRFAPSVPVEEIEASLVLAVLATESVHGESQVRLDAAHYLDSETRTCVVQSDTPVGQDFSRHFTNFLRREFGDDAFTVERVEDDPHRKDSAA